MIKRIYQILIVLLYMTLFFGCNESNTSNKQDSSPTVVAVEVGIDRVETLESDTSDEDTIMTDEINIEYLYNAWKLVSRLENDVEIYHEENSNTELMKLNRDKTFVYHSINQFGNYDYVYIGKWDIEDKYIIFKYDDGYETKEMILSTTRKNITWINVSVNGDTIENAYTDKYEVYTKTYDFDDSDRPMS